MARVELGEHGRLSFTLLEVSLTESVALHKTQIMGARPLGSWIGGDPADWARGQARAITTEEGLQAATAAKQMVDGSSIKDMEDMKDFEASLVHHEQAQ